MISNVKWSFLTAVLFFAISGITNMAPSLKAANTQRIWLSALDISKMSSGWGAPQANKSIQQKPLLIAGERFSRGVGTHADSLMYINLDGRALRFTAKIGIDDETAGKGTVKFMIYGDGKKLYDSGIIKGGQKSRLVDINLQGVKKLILIVTAAGDGQSYDHADWADACIEYQGHSPIATNPPVEKKVILTPKPGPAPKINGPKVLGARPGNPFIYRIPATGKRPMLFSVQHLPATLKLNTHTGIITGNSPAKRGDYVVTLTAKNSYGTATRKLKIVVGSTLALTPPMGWNSWYIYYARVTDADLRAAADAMIASGMADFGYRYVNIDDCWAKKHGDKPYRGVNGAVLANKKFPDMKALTDYIHNKGLLAGIYTSPGPWTCAGYVGAYQHEQADAKQFADWGFDFLKYDWCSYGSVAKNRSLEELIKPYKKMGNILERLPRDIVFNLCQYGMGKVWKWADKVAGNCWRTTGDLGLSPTFLSIGLSNAQHYKYAKPGHWNDPDYILIGWVGDAHRMGKGKPTSLTPNQQYSYMSMWCMMAAPLIFSGDMTKLDDFTLNILCNAEVIDIDQDPLGKQGKIIAKTDDHFIMVKDLQDGSKAVGLFSTSPVEQIFTVKWDQLNIKGKYKARNLWTQKDTGIFDGEFSAKVAPKGVVLIRLFPVK